MNDEDLLKMDYEVMYQMYCILEPGIGSALSGFPGVASGILLPYFWQDLAAD